MLPPPSPPPSPLRPPPPSPPAPPRMHCPKHTAGISRKNPTPALAKIVNGSRRRKWPMIAPQEREHRPEMTSERHGRHSACREPCLGYFSLLNLSCKL